MFYPGLREGAPSEFLRRVSVFSVRRDHDPAAFHRTGQGMACLEEEKREERKIGAGGASLFAPGWGMMCRLRRGSRACRPMDFSPASVSEGFQRASGKPFCAPAGAYPLPRRGLTRRLRRGSRACRPMGRSHFSFVGERKVCKRKPAARRLREKALNCPFLKEGVRNVARRPVSELTHTFVRARAHSFPLSKRARLFPSAAYRRPRPRSWVYTYSNFAGWMLRCSLDISATQNASVVSNPRWHF